MKFSTKAIHSGQEPEKEFGAVIPPVYLTSTYAQKSPGEYNGYDYTRAGNPNFTNLETALANLEQAKYATVFSSGLGAITGIVNLLKQGDLVIGINDLYGGTYRLFTRVFSKFGIKFERFAPEDKEGIDSLFAKKPKMIFLESPTNPLLRIIDIEAFAQKAHEHGVIVVVDNTFASPYFQNPLLLGADLVIQSSTKYLGGHSDLIGGAVMTNNEDYKKELDFARMAIGLNPSPFDCWMLSRSLKTLAVRMKQHEENALAVAKFLKSHSLVERVLYPGLESHPGHEIAKKQMSGFSGIVSVEFKLSLEESKKLISSFKLFTLAESLGGVESLVDHPASMTHSSIPKEEREKAGLMDGLVRFSVGIEDKEDLIEDLEGVLNRFI